MAVSSPPPAAPGGPASAGTDRLRPYVPRLLVEWLRSTPDLRWREVDGTLAFVDISGFTRLTERLARRGRIGAEELSDTLSTVFSGLLSVAYDDGAGLVKWGGDAVLLLFEGDEHAVRAAGAAYRMRQTLRDLGKVETSAGRVQLRMSVGLHSGRFHFFLVGDPGLHRELLISGPAASRTADVEGLAKAGEVGLSPATASLLAPRLVRPGAEGSFLLAGEPRGSAWPAPALPDTAGFDLGSVLSAPVRAHLLAGGGEPEHRSIAVAFVQFSGTDAMLRTAGPDRLADALDECVRNVQEASDRHGVTFFETDINADGGKIMLVAGAPTSAGHNEERLLLAARLVLDRPGTLPVRIGVNSGPVFSGDFGPSFRRTYSVKGDAVNLAARVMGKAAPGQLLATADALGRSRTTFETEPLAPFMVKGKARAVEAASVGRPLRGDLTRTHLLPLVGRERELATLTAALDRARARAGTVVELVGEPGIGKSRLVAELTSAAPDVQVVAAGCDEYESSTPYHPFRQLLREVCGLAPGDEPAEVLRRLVDRVAPNDPALVPWLPLLGIPLDLPLPATDATLGLAEAFRKAKVDEVCVSFLTAALPTAALLVVDDVHLMDDASAELLARLCEGVSARPWLVLVTRREVEAGFVPAQALGADAVVSVRPQPLDPATALALVDRVTENAPIPSHRMAAIAERAGGNPLFLQSLLAAARSDETLPDSVESLVTSQIDRLPADERALLRCAAVLGVSFGETQLRRMLQGEQLPTGRETLQRLGDFLEPAGHGRFRFRHALIRDAAYEGLPYRRRRDLHGRVGETLEATAESPEDLAELLSLHFFHAGRHDRAWHYSRVAGRRSQEKYAYVESAEFLRRAVESARRLPTVDPGELTAVWESLGDVLTLVGAVDEARAAFRAARRGHGDDPLHSAQLLLKEAKLDRHEGRLAACMRVLSRGLGLLGPSEDQQVLATRSLFESFYAWCRFGRGDYRQAVRWGAAAEEHALAAGDRRALAQTYAVLQQVSMWSPYAHERPYGDMALGLYAELGDRHQQANLHNNLAGAAFFDGRWTDAVGLYARAQEEYHQVGDEMGVATATYNEAEITSRQGRYDEAEAQLRHARAAATAMGDRDLAAMAGRELGRVMARTGRLDEGRATLRAARAQFTELGEVVEALATDLELAGCLVAEGDARGALEACDDAAARARARAEDAVALMPTLRRLRGEALASLGRVDEAKAELEAALASSQAGGAYEAGFIMVDLAAVSARLGDPAAERRRAEGLGLLAGLGVQVEVVLAGA